MTDPIFLHVLLYGSRVIATVNGKRARVREQERSKIEAWTVKPREQEERKPAIWAVDNGARQ